MKYFYIFYIEFVRKNFIFLADSLRDIAEFAVRWP